MLFSEQSTEITEIDNVTIHAPGCKCLKTFNRPNIIYWKLQKKKNIKVKNKLKTILIVFEKFRTK